MDADRRTFYLIGAVVLLGFFVLLFWRLIFVVIPAGHAGVRYDLFFGTLFGRVAREGLAVKLPWNLIYVYDVRLRSSEQTVSALSREGMNVDVDFVVLFRPKPDALPRLHTEIGPDYAERAVVPITVGAVRQYISQHDSHELYTIEALALQTEIMGATRSDLDRKHVVIQDVVMKRLSLPAHVVAAIEEKLTQQQRAASYEFRLEAEAAEAERLRIKGVGLQRYYSTVERRAHAVAADVAGDRGHDGGGAVGQPQGRHRGQWQAPAPADPRQRHHAPGRSEAARASGGPLAPAETRPAEARPAGALGPRRLGHPAASEDLVELDQGDRSGRRSCGSPRARRRGAAARRRARRNACRSR